MANKATTKKKRPATKKKPAAKAAGGVKKKTARAPKAKPSRKKASKPAAAKPKAAKATTKKTAPKKSTAKKAATKAPAKPAKGAQPAKAAKPAKAPKQRKAGENGSAAGVVAKTKPARADAKKGDARKQDAKKTGAKSRVPEPAPPTSLSDARAAASKLAAAAGLPTLKARSTPGDAEIPEADKLDRTPLTKKELEYFREILVEKRKQVAGDVSDMEKEAFGRFGAELSSLPQHMADQGSDEYDQSLSLGLAASQRELLKEIDAALDRIEKNTYGVCESLQIPIAKERLEATPWARYSLDGARRLDRGRQRS